MEHNLVFADSSVAVADEVVMTISLGVEADGRALQSQFTHQACFDQSAKAVVDGCARGARIGPVEYAMNFTRRRVHRTPHQEFHHSVALRCTAKPTRRKKSSICGRDF